MCSISVALSDTRSLTQAWEFSGLKNLRYFIYFQSGLGVFAQFHTLFQFFFSSSGFDMMKIHSHVMLTTYPSVNTRNNLPVLYNQGAEICLKIQVYEILFSTCSFYSRHHWPQVMLKLTIFICIEIWRLVPNQICVFSAVFNG